MGEEAQFIARYASVHIAGSSFTEVGDALAARGFNLLAATQTEQGILVVPHRRSNRAAAHVFRQLPPVEPEFKPLDAPSLLASTPMEHQLMSVELASVTIESAKVESGVLDDAPDLQCRGCGAVHPEGAICVIPIFFEPHCCTERTYPHRGPHEAAAPDGLITHRWIEELVVTDMPFNGYHHLSEEDIAAMEGDDQ